MNERKSFPIIKIILVLSFIYFAWTLLGQQKMLDEKSSQLKLVKQSIAEEEKTNKELQDQKKNINSDKYAEKIAREKLGMLKDGEKKFIDTNK